MTRPATKISKITAKILNLAIAFRNRRALLALGGWDARQLKDIGLTRSDVCNALSHPVGDDPAAILSGIRSSRRRYRRVAARPMIQKSRVPREPSRARCHKTAAPTHPHVV